MPGRAPKFVAAARAKNWKVAYDECNGADMAGMLDGLQEIGPQLVSDMRSQMATFDVWGGPNMPRILFAMTVVQERRIPASPGLPADQVEDAKQFLTRPAGTVPGPRKSVRIALFWTDAAQGEALSTLLIQRTRELLRDNGTGFDLDVAPFRGAIKVSGELIASSDFENAMALAKVAASYAFDRLCVIFFQATPVECDPNLQHCPRLPYGLTPRDGDRPFVFINVAVQQADRATLLHEIGHAAGVTWRDSDDLLKDLTDVMSYGPRRTKVGVNQLNLLRRPGLFFVR